jgi:membrane fusion protein (multidrug efflux system)
MKTKIHLTGLITLTLSCLLFITGCGKNEGNGNPDSATKDLNIIVPVSVATAGLKDISVKKTFAGSLEGIRQSKIVARIPERITAINVKVGDFVKAGDVVIQLDKTGQSSQFLQAQANLNNVEKELDRMKALFKEGAISQQNLDQVQTAYDIAKANFEAAKNTVELTSPISGRVTAINVNAGDWVVPGIDLAIVASIEEMIIKFNVSETEVQDFKIGTDVFVYSEFDKDLMRKGKVVEINRSASIEARSFQIKAKFPNTKDSFYKPGMFVKADVILQSKKNILVIPTLSITQKSDGNYVFIIKNNLSFSRKIKTGLSDESVEGGFTEIIDGLSKGDTVVIAGMNNLSDSTKVTIIE